MKYVETDIEDGLRLIRIGLSNIMFNIAKGNIDSYELNTPITMDTICNVLDKISPNIEFCYNLDNKDYWNLYQDGKTITITIEENSKGNCIFKAFKNG